MWTGDELHTTNYNIQITHRNIHTTKCTWQTTNFELKVNKPLLLTHRVNEYERIFRLNIEYTLQITNYTLQTTNYKLQPTNYIVQNTTDAIHTTNYKIQTTHLKYKVKQTTNMNCSHGRRWTYRCTCDVMHTTNYKLQTANHTTHTLHTIQYTWRNTN